MMDPTLQELGRLLEEGFPDTRKQGEGGDTKEVEKGDIGGATCCTSRGGFYEG